MTASLSELLAHAARGDAGARHRLLEELYPAVRQQVHAALTRDFRGKHRWILPLFSTGDIVQDVFLGVVQGSDAFLGRSEPELRAWISKQVQNRIIDRVRFHLAQKRDARKRVAAADGSGGPGHAAREPSPPRCAVLEERASQLAAALDQLTEQERRLWQLRFEEERSYAEVAEAVGYSGPESARSAFRAVRARLIVILHSLGFDAPGEVTR